MRVVSESTYRKNIKDNITLLETALEGGEYPNLAEVLNAYGRSLYRKLQVLLEYFSNYGHDIKQRMSYSDSRGWEMMASYEVMTTLGAGMDKATWEKAVLKLITMDILRMFRPRTVEEYRYLNTDVQQLSAERALASGRKPVNWYHVPKYTKQRLKAADDLARAVKAGAAIDKDSLRDKLGAKQANRITDTGFDIYPDADDRRDTLEWMLGVKLRTFGYTTSKELISEAMEFDKSKGYTYKRWLQTWTAYKPFLFDKYGLHENKPSKAEKEKWGLVSDGWIVRARS